MVDKLAKAAGHLGTAPQEPGRIREDRQGRVDGCRQPLAGRPACRADHPACLPQERRRRRLPPARRRRPRTTRIRPTSPSTATITGPIQAAEAAGSSFAARRVIPATEGASLKDERVKKQTYNMIYEVKLKETMGIVFQELVKMSAIENKLVGTVKLANEEQHDDFNSSTRASQAHEQRRWRGRAARRMKQRPAASAAASRTAVREPSRRRRSAASPRPSQHFENMQDDPLRSSQDANGQASAGLDGSPAFEPILTVPSHLVAGSSSISVAAPALRGRTVLFPFGPQSLCGVTCPFLSLGGSKPMSTTVRCDRHAFTGSCWSCGCLPSALPGCGYRQNLGHRADGDRATAADQRLGLPPSPKVDFRPLTGVPVVPRHDQRHGRRSGLGRLQPPPGDADAGRPAPRRSPSRPSGSSRPASEPTVPTRTTSWSASPQTHVPPTVTGNSVRDDPRALVA